MDASDRQTPDLFDKRALRREARAVRATLDAPALSASVVERLSESDVIRSADHLLLFSPLEGEIDVTPLVARFPQAAYYFPRMGEQDALTFHRVTRQTPMVANRYGVAEPPADAPLWPADARGAVIVPALMADARGHRLGYGKACYDRFLAQKTAQSLISMVVIAEALFVSRLPTVLQPWDFPAHWIVTERRVLKASPS